MVDGDEQIFSLWVDKYCWESEKCQVINILSYSDCLKAIFEADDKIAEYFFFAAEWAWL